MPVKNVTGEQASEDSERPGTQGINDLNCINDPNILEGIGMLHRGNEIMGHPGFLSASIANMCATA